MQKKPTIIYITAVFLVVFSVVVGIMAITQVGIIPAASLTVDLWAICAGSLLTAIGVWRVRPWGFFAFLFLVVTIVGRDIQNIIQKKHSTSLLDFLDLFLISLGLLFILKKHARTPYFDPHIRWWERPPRHLGTFEASLDNGGQMEVCEILDLSKTGSFVDTDAKLLIGQIVGLQLKVSGLEFKSPAKVVRVSAKPKGLGLMFIDTTSENMTTIKKIIRDLEAKPPAPPPSK